MVSTLTMSLRRTLDRRMPLTDDYEPMCSAYSLDIQRGCQSMDTLLKLWRTTWSLCEQEATNTSTERRI